MEQSPSWEAKHVLSKSTNSPHFIKTEVSLPHSQEPAICANPEPLVPHAPPTSSYLKIIVKVTVPTVHA